jgi:hypothetical protein
MPIYAFLTSTYAMNIYLYGTQRLTARDGYSGVREGYYIPVEQYAANKFRLDQIQNALNSGWITQQEYEETLVYNPALVPSE